MILGDKIALLGCDKKLWHEFYKYYVSDPMMESGSFKYDYDKVESAYHTKTSDTSRLYFFIVRKNIVIGQVYLKRMDKLNKTTEIGIALINDTVKGKGYGTEAIRLMIDYCFNVLGFNKVLADTVLKNTRSQHILEKIGFKFLNQDDKFKYYELTNKNLI